jgi:adenosylhomocysteine nucleosidase
LVARSDQKRRLGKQAEAVEMESYAILAEAARFGVPSVAIRAIGDTVDFDMPYDFERACDARGQVRAAKIVAQVLRRPSGVPRLLTLARDSRLAARQLANFLDAFTGTLADRLIPIESSMVATR